MPKKTKEQIKQEIIEKELSRRKITDFVQDDQELFKDLNPKYKFWKRDEIALKINKLTEDFKKFSGGAAEAHSANVMYHKKKFAEKIEKAINKNDPTRLLSKQLEDTQIQIKEYSSIMDNKESEWEEYIMNKINNSDGTLNENIENLGDIYSIAKKIDEELEELTKARIEKAGSNNVKKANFLESNTFQGLEYDANQIVREFYKAHIKYNELINSVPKLEQELESAKQKQNIDESIDENVELNINAEKEETNKIFNQKNVLDIEKERDKAIKQYDEQIQEQKRDATIDSLEIPKLERYLELRKKMDMEYSLVDEEKLENTWNNLNKKKAEFDGLNWWQQFWAKRLPSDWYSKAALYEEIQAREEVMKNIGYEDADISEKYTNYLDDLAQEKENKANSNTVDDDLNQSLENNENQMENEQNELNQSLADLTNVGGFTKNNEEKSQTYNNEKTLNNPSMNK